MGLEAKEGNLLPYLWMSMNRHILPCGISDECRLKKFYARQPCEFVVALVCVCGLFMGSSLRRISRTVSLNFFKYLFKVKSIVSL